jgi:hypothetical protein
MSVGMPNNSANQPDLYHGDGNSTVDMPFKVTSHAGETDPGILRKGNKLNTTQVIQPGYHE